VRIMVWSRLVPTAGVADASIPQATDATQAGVLMAACFPRR
jgi:hypothetical protein